ncbi:MAG: tRNA lysidine(34) synthetase TilS [Deltaproteobacteria bacterium]|nr:tRNA lysidine(34) synthetase TilS [Deltaproteobacteria bacterium]
MDPIKDTIKKVGRTISRHRMLNPGDLCIVAVSGGADSVCLLDILNELKAALGIRLVAAHFDHGLREGEDDAETRFVRDLASSMNLPFESEKAASLMDGASGSVEEKARDARYIFLESLREDLSAQKIAMGHHLNDQAETVLMRLLRGTGPSGLTGIPPFREKAIIRPLIDIKKEEIESYCKARDLTYKVDSSNLQKDYLRNRIRLELLPSLLEYQPRLIEHLGRLAGILRDENAYMEGRAEDWIVRNADLRSTGEVSIPIPSFLGLPQPIRNRVIRQILRKVGKGLRRIDSRHIESVADLGKSKNSHSSLNLPNGLMVQRSYDRMVFRIGEGEELKGFHYLLDGAGTYFIEEIGQTIGLVEVEPKADLNLEGDERTAYLDQEKLEFPLIFRNFRLGDRFVPLGMTGHKKIKDFFIDLKIPVESRALIPLLVSGNQPIWIGGYRIDDRYKVTSKTKRILEVFLHEWMEKDKGPYAR